MTENAPGEKEGIGKQGSGTPHLGEQAVSGPVPGRLGDLAAAVGMVGRGPAPVEGWHPPYCGDIDLRIAADGTWHYAGTPITRRPLVELFASILRRDLERFVLVTPVECVGIAVEDAPFVAVAMAVAGMQPARLSFVTNIGDEVEIGAAHPLRFETEPDGGVRPYLLVRGGLWARLTRSLAIDLLDRVEEEDGVLGLRSGASFFPLQGPSPDAAA